MISIEEILNPVDEVVGNIVEDVEELVLQVYNQQAVELDDEDEIQGLDYGINWFKKGRRILI
jgi:hypothetical protein